jgi:hypothetical protein
MSNPRQRFTDQEKLSIMEEAYLTGLEPTLQKYHLTTAIFTRWQKKFRKSNARNSGQLIVSLNKEIEKLNKIVAAQDAKVNTAQPIVQPVFNQKEDDLLKLVASLMVEIVLKEDTPSRE